jgi:hypothetical protein
MLGKEGGVMSCFSARAALAIRRIRADHEARMTIGKRP